MLSDVASGLSIAALSTHVKQHQVRLAVVRCVSATARAVCSVSQACRRIHLFCALLSAKQLAYENDL
jgi:hypothetical protein